MVSLRLLTASRIASRPIGSVAALLVSIGVAGACASSASEPPGSGVDAGGGSSGTGSGGSSGSAGSGGASGTGASSGSGGSGGGTFDAGSDAPPDPDAACGLVTEKANASPLNLYIVMDKSSTMVGSKWDSAIAGLTAFLNDANSAGINIAIKFFPRPPDSTPACDQMAYSTPTVPFDTLPNNAQPIITALNAEAPNGFSTPTYPALGGAILKGIELAQNDPASTSAVLLVTDGVPEGISGTCAGGVDPNTTQAVSTLAFNGFNFTPSVPTYVIGLPGVDQTFADTVAQAGGSGSAIVIGSTNVEVEFRNALKKIRGQALPCEYDVPSDVGSSVDLDRVNVVFTPSDGSDAQTIPQATDCSGGTGWVYDDPSNPKKIELCPGSCSTVQDDFEASLDILLGCKTVVQ